MEAVRNQHYQLKSKQPLPMCIHNKEKEYLATVTSGDPCIIR